MCDHKFAIDKTRKHKRPPRVFIFCAKCDVRGQGVINNGHLKVFKINSPKYAPILIDVTPEQKERLRAIGNQSEIVRTALDRYFEQVYTSPYIT